MFYRSKTGWPWSGRSAVIALLMLASGTASAATRPNIVFIMSDDHAVRAVSAYDASLLQTPNIDRIADAGMRFDRAYVGNSICGPSRATALTGLHSHGNGFYSNEWSGPFDGRQQTFPALLREAGYHTAVIGKWHLYSDPIGFDQWQVIDNLAEQGTYYNPVFRSPEGEEATSGYVADIITDKSIAWLESVAQSDRPFMLIHNHKAPHRDWLPGPEELENWDEAAQVPEPDTLFRTMDGEVRARREARMSIRKFMTDNDVKLSPQFGKSLTEEQLALWEQAFGAGNEAFKAAELEGDEEVRWKYQRYIKTYLASVKSMDRQIGRLLNYLEKQELVDNTLVVYTSDQGFFLGENGWFDKRWMDEVSSRVPLLVQWPGKIQAGSSSSALVQNIDFAPTLLDAAGVEPREPMHGISLLPLLEGGAEPSQRDLYYHFYENPGFHGVARHYGIRAERYRLVHYYEDGEWELFDLLADPQDQRNLYGDPALDAVVADLKQRLQALRLQYEVPEEDPRAPWYHGPLIRLAEQLMKLL